MLPKARMGWSSKFNKTNSVKTDCGNLYHVRSYWISFSLSKHQPTCVSNMPWNLKTIFREENLLGGNYLVIFFNETSPEQIFWQACSDELIWFVETPATIAWHRPERDALAQQSGFFPTISKITNGFQNNFLSPKHGVTIELGNQSILIFSAAILYSNVTHGTILRVNLGPGPCFMIFAINIKL